MTSIIYENWAITYQKTLTFRPPYQDTIELWNFTAKVQEHQ